MRRNAWKAAAILLLASTLAACGGSGGTDSGPGPSDTADAPDVPDLSDLPGVPDAVPDAPPADVPDAADPGPSIDAWAPFDDPPSLDFARFQGRVALSAFLPFAHHWKPGTPKADAAHLGDFAVGNGRTFALLGLAFPLNTLHGMVGPTYARRDRFYGDLAMRLGDAAGTPREFDEEWIGTFRDVPAVMTVGRSGDLRVASIDLAPAATADVPVRPAHASIWRAIAVRNDGAAASAPATLVVTTNLAQQVRDDTIVEARKDGLRVAWFKTAGATATETSLTLPVPAIEPGAEWTTNLILATAAPDADPVTVPMNFGGDTFEGLLDETKTAYRAFESPATQVRTPDPLVDATFVNLRRMLWVQVSAQGASSPMSRYTMAWTRDLSGVVRPLLALGAIPLAERVMDYYYAVAANAGWLTDAYEADLEVDLENPPAVEWEALVPLVKKAQAEGPAYLPMMYAWLRASTGATDRIAARIGYLRHAIFGEAISPEYLLPFSGDETYRASMNIAFGLDLEYEHHLKSWSLSSGMLLATGARALADLEDALGSDHAEAANAARTLATNVEAATHQAYGMEDGCLSAFITKDGGKLWPPHEDAVLTGTWGGAPWDRAPDVDLALTCLLARVPFGPGAFQSPMDPLYDGIFGLPIYKGVYTGMLPGYTLRAMTDAGHPDAEAAFQNLRRSMSPSGNYPEYSVADDHSALEFIYDPSGGLGDYTARYRPWEGGINLEALFHYLTGFVPDAPAARVRLRPHLPAGWPSMAVSPLFVGDSRLSLEVRRDGNARVVTVERLAGSQLAVSLVHDGTGPGAPVATLDGTDVPAASMAVETHFGTAVATLPDCVLSDGAGSACTWTIR